MRARRWPEVKAERELLDRLRSVTAKYDDGNGEGEALARQALEAVRQRLRTGGKRCSACKRTRPLTEFGFNSSRPDGLAAACRNCERSRDAARK